MESKTVKELVNDIENKQESIESKPEEPKTKILLKEKNKKYYDNNKEKLRTYYKQKVNCEFCDSELNKGSLNTHRKSKQCKKKQELKIELAKLNKLINN